MQLGRRLTDHLQGPQEEGTGGSICIAIARLPCALLGYRQSYHQQAYPGLGV